MAEKEDGELRRSRSQTKVEVLPSAYEFLKDGSTDNRTHWANKVLDRMTFKDVTNEFKVHKDWRPPQFSTLVCHRHRDKNRYGDIPCLDLTRVELKERPAERNYINASWVAMPDGSKYISTQGPLSNTVEDFWHMVFTERANVVVMLCQWTEGSIEKCKPYFSRDKTEQFGEYGVRVREQTCLSSAVRHTVIECERRGSKHVVQHIWYQEWPDQLGPVEAAPLLQVYKLVLEKAQGQPVVVHCSAGIGRTATFVGIHFAAMKIKENPETRILDVLMTLRTMRHRAIQSQLQYAFLYLCLFELFIMDGVLEKSKKFSEYRTKYTTTAKRISARVRNKERVRSIEK